MLSNLDFKLIDIIAVSVFFLSWFSHYFVVSVSPLRVHSISHQMVAVRRKWMRNMISRKGAPIDALIQNGLQQGVLFFGSTSVLLIGALVAGLGASDKAVAILQNIPFSTTNNEAQWEVKLLLILLIFTFAFFKFAWSYRLFNYVIILIGASPNPDTESEQLEDYADRLSRLHALAASHFTIGLNSYFFALSAITWFLNSWVFMASTVWISIVLYRRAFRSRFSAIFNGKYKEEY